MKYSLFFYLAILGLSFLHGFSEKVASVQDYDDDIHDIDDAEEDYYNDNVYDNDMYYDDADDEDYDYQYNEDYDYDDDDDDYDDYDDYDYDDDDDYDDYDDDDEYDDDYDKIYHNLLSNNYAIDLMEGGDPVKDLSPITSKGFIFGKDRKFFGTEVKVLFHATHRTAGEKIAKALEERGKNIIEKGLNEKPGQGIMHLGQRGWFGPAIYFAKTPKAAHTKWLKLGTSDKNTRIVMAVVALGKPKLMDEAAVRKSSAHQYTFKKLQEEGYDSVYAPKMPGVQGYGDVAQRTPEWAVYNPDQVTVMGVSKYKTIIDSYPNVD